MLYFCLDIHYRLLARSLASTVMLITYFGFRRGVRDVAQPNPPYSHWVRDGLSKSGQSGMWRLPNLVQ